MTTSHSTILRIRDYGVQPDTGSDACEAFRALLRDAAEIDHPVLIQLEAGRYDFYREHASKETYFITNSTSELENPDNTKSIGIHLKNLSNVTIDGNGALLMYHGKMTPIVIDRCLNLKIHHLSVDFERPTMSEMRVESTGDAWIDFAIHRDSWYAIERERLVWIGEGWQYASGPAQVFDPVLGQTWRTWNPVADAFRAEELAPFKVRLHYKTNPATTTVGHIFQMRDGIRDQAGTFIVQSENIILDRIHFGYLHGLGLVAQFSKQLAYQNLTCSPRSETGRTAAAFADFIQVSGCQGTVRISNSRFSGAHDDAINVHGTYLKIVEKIDERCCKVRFMHPQTYGFDPFYPGDRVDFIHRTALTAMGNNVIRTVSSLNPREFRLEFAERIPDAVCLGDGVENVSWTPEVEITGNHFSCIPTRGILVTTRQKVVIQNNTFNRMQMSGIVIANDCQSWFESGLVRDVLISRNRFLSCGDPVIGILPENEDVQYSAPVHRNIRIEHNHFELAGTAMVNAKSTQGLVIQENTVIGADSETNPLVKLEACSDVRIENNRLSVRNKRIHLLNMPADAVAVVPSLALEIQ